MQEDRQDAESEGAFHDAWMDASEMAAKEEATHAEGSLESVFKVVVAGVYGLVISIIPGEALNGPAKGTRHEKPIAVGTNCEISRLHLQLDSSRVFGNHRRIHLI